MRLAGARMTIPAFILATMACVEVLVNCCFPRVIDRALLATSMLSGHQLIQTKQTVDLTLKVQVQTL